jgi:hypothetical protein
VTESKFDQRFWEELWERTLRQHADKVAQRPPNDAVAPGGTLFMVGHRPFDPSTGVATAAVNQVQVSVEDAIATLEPSRWEFIVAEERPRPVAGTGVAAVIRARRRYSKALVSV